MLILHSGKPFPVYEVFAALLSSPLTASQVESQVILTTER